MTIKAVIFDAYGTLFNEGKEAIDDVGEQISRDLSVPKSQVLQIWKRRYLALEAGFNHSFMRILDANETSLGGTFEELSLPVPRAKGYVDIIKKRWSHPPLYPDVLEALRELGKRYTLGVLTNSDNDTIEAALKYASLPISYYLTSEQAGCYKPDKRIFDQALRSLEVSAREAVYVGNSPVDILGAKNAGMHMIHLNRHRIPSSVNGVKADLTIDSAGDLLEKIKSLS